MFAENGFLIGQMQGFESLEAAEEFCDNYAEKEDRML
jgi:hypothetical protein